MPLNTLIRKLAKEKDEQSSFSEERNCLIFLTYHINGNPPY